MQGQLGEISRALAEKEKGLAEQRADFLQLQRALVEHAAPAESGRQAGPSGGRHQTEHPDELAEARQEANALTRRVAELQGGAEAERSRSSELISSLRRERDEAQVEAARQAEALSEAERLSTQRAAAAAAERREAATLRTLFEAAQSRHEQQAGALQREVASLQAQREPATVSARQLPLLMEALEACQRERQLAVGLSLRVARAEAAALGSSLRDLEEEMAAAHTSSAEAVEAAEGRRRAEVGELRREAASSKKKATQLLMERDREALRLQAQVRQLQAREVLPTGAQTPQDAAASQETISALRLEVARLRRQTEEWQLRNLELHQAMRIANATGGSGTDGAAERILEVAKQQAQRDEELMGARIQVSELQGQLLEARELHTALKERCADFERQLARTEHGGGLGRSNIEYLKNVIFKLFVLEDGLEKLLPVVATFLQFSPDEMQKIKQARANGTGGVNSGSGGGGSLFGVLGEDWLFGDQKKRPPRSRAQPVRSDEQVEGGQWQQLEVSFKKTQRLKHLLFASQAHVERYQAEQQLLQQAVAVLQRRLQTVGGDTSVPSDGSPEPGAVEAPQICDLPVTSKPSPATPVSTTVKRAGAPPPSPSWSSSAKRMTRVNDRAAIPESLSHERILQPSPEDPPEVTGVSTPLAVARAVVRIPSPPYIDDESDAEKAAELALEEELQADAAARRTLDEALAARSTDKLQAAIRGMRDRGLDSDDPRVDEARMVLDELRH